MAGSMPPDTRQGTGDKGDGDGEAWMPTFTRFNPGQDNLVKHLPDRS